MAKNDIVIYSDATYTPGAKRFAVAASTAGTSINVGELVQKNLAATSVKAWANNYITKPVVASDFIAGLAASTSTETTSVAGTVDVVPIVPGMTFLGNPTVAATFGVGSTPVQATYDALVGARVLIDNTSGTQTILAVDGSTYGIVIEPMSVTLHPVRLGSQYVKH